MCIRDRVYLVTPAGGDDEMTARLTEKAKYHFDAEIDVYKRQPSTASP